MGIEGAGGGFACLTRKPAEVGFPILGTYEYDDFGTPSAPRVNLTTDATGSYFQRHGVSPQPIEWGILYDPTANAPVGVESMVGAQILLIYKTLDAGVTECTPGLVCDPNNPMLYSDGVGEWQAAQLSVSFASGDDAGMMYILGERLKACDSPGNDGQKCQYRPGIKEYQP